MTHNPLANTPFRVWLAENAEKVILAAGVAVFVAALFFTW